MTLYARSDVMSVALSKDHGGCGATHTRPVTHGAPAKVWALDCAPCEDHLRSDPHWAVDALEIPETPDEIRARETQEKRGEHAQKQNLENAVASLAATADGFQKLMAVMFASNPQMAENMNKMLAMMSAPTDSVAMRGAAEMTSVNEARKMQGLPPLGESSDDLAELKIGELRALAKARGVDSTGTRDDLLKRLRSS